MTDGLVRAARGALALLLLTIPAAAQTPSTAGHAIAFDRDTAMWLATFSLSTSAATAAHLHRVEGIVVYFGGLPAMTR